MLPRLLISAVFATALVSCSFVPPASSLTPDAARLEAQRDFASGRMKIYLAGTIAAGSVGVDTQRDLTLVTALPRDNRPSRGCTDPDSQVHIAYARAYNREIVRLLRGHPNT
jgi:hypothetical protein